MEIHEKDFREIHEKDFSGAYAAWNAALHPDDRVCCAAAIAGDSNFDLEFRIVWPSGEVRHIERHARVQRDADGIATRMIGVNMDITQRKQADARIAYLNRVYAVLSGINPLIVRARDRDELFRDACRVALDAGGFCYPMRMQSSTQTAPISARCAGAIAQHLQASSESTADEQNLSTHPLPTECADYSQERFAKACGFGHIT